MGASDAACAPNAGRTMARATRTTRTRGLGWDAAARGEDSDAVRVACGDSDVCVRAGGRRCLRPRHAMKGGLGLGFWRSAVAPFEWFVNCASCGQETCGLL